MNSKWDCHAHVFGPYGQYPLASGRSYSPNEALLEDYLALLKSLDLQKGVLVHPSAYGQSYELLLDCLEKEKSLRGVIVINATSPINPQGLRDKGIRGARFSARSGTNMNFFGSASFDDFLSLGGQLSSSGLHAELWTDCKKLPEIEKQLLQSPVDVVIDHMGGFDVHLGTQDPGFQCLLRLLDSGKIWLKLCAYRNLLQAANIDIGQPFHTQLLHANPDRLVWGTDWPHLNISPAPATKSLLDTLTRWTNDTQLLEKILSINPSQLYQ
jgi:predicted TIM-barrel fold metal-dependent hydrolase